MKKWTTPGGTTVYRILKGRCNCYLIINRQDALLIDSGGKAARKTLFCRLNKLLPEKPLFHHLLTHTHFDHTGNTRALAEHYRITPLVHRAEADLLRRGINPPIKALLSMGKPAVRLLALGAVKKRLNYPPCTQVSPLTEEKVLFLGSTRVHIIPTPGHTDGSLSVIVDGHIALVGDTLFGGISRHITPPYGTDGEELEKSWQKLLSTGACLFLPGHGKPLSADQIRKNLCKKRGPAQRPSLGDE